MKVNVIYIDDTIDPELSEYLDKYLESDLLEYGKAEVEVSYDEVEYVPSEGLLSLLKNPYVQKANVAIIDSKLFTTESAEKGMLSGEEFRLFLRRFFPYIESLVITQNNERLREELQVVSKYDRNASRCSSPHEYYSKNLPGIIGQMIDDLNAFRVIGRELRTSGVDAVLLEKVKNSLEGVSEFDELTKSDIDNAIRSFEHVKELIRNAD